MDAILEGIQYALLLLGKLILFMVLSVIFLPAFLINTYLQEIWTKMAADLFGI